jgi:hypothetical protein
LQRRVTREQRSACAVTLGLPTSRRTRGDLGSPCLDAPHEASSQVRCGSEQRVLGSAKGLQRASLREQRRFRLQESRGCLRLAVRA